MEFRQPIKEEFEQVKQWVEEFWLDNSDMKPEQFSVLSDNGKVIAFGRLREHTDATELCTMGVATEFQKKNYGNRMVTHLLSIAKRNVYLVTIIPTFFSKMGFTVTDEYPDSLQRKVNMCRTEYHVDEPYFVMKWEIT